MTMFQDGIDDTVEQVLGPVITPQPHPGPSDSVVDGKADPDQGNFSGLGELVALAVSDHEVDVDAVEAPFEVKKVGDSYQVIALEAGSIA